MKIEIDDLTRPAIRALLDEHLQDMYRLSPPESVHAYDLERLRASAITFWSAWEGALLLACGGLEELDPAHGEVKSMRAAGAHRRKSAGRAILAHIIAVARSRGYQRLSLETGAMAAFEPARKLYESAGFSYCGPFGEYIEDPHSVFMTMRLQVSGGQLAPDQDDDADKPSPATAGGSVGGTRQGSVVQVAETDRLRLRWLDASDAAFIFELVNDPSWLRYIGDKGVRTLQDAANYIERGPAAMYQRLGFGLYLVELKRTREPVGICGLIKRPGLQDEDLGFAFLPRFWDQGYAVESASAVMSHARKVLGLGRIVAILSHDNHRSGKLLGKLGFRFERTIRLQADDDELDLYAAAS